MSATKDNERIEKTQVAQLTEQVVEYSTLFLHVFWSSELQFDVSIFTASGIVY